MTRARRRPFSDAARGALVVAACGIVVLGGRAGTHAQVPPLRVLASNGVKAVLETLSPQATRAIGRLPSMAFDTSAALAGRIRQGEAFDVVVMTADTIDLLAREGRVARTTVQAIGRSRIGVGVRAGTPLPDIASPEAIRLALLAAPSITYAQDGASRAHIDRMLSSLGIAAVVNAKTVLEQGSVRAAERVVRGDASWIITLMSEIVPVEGLAYAGPLPDRFQHPVAFAAALATSAPQGDTGRAFIGILLRPETRAIFAAKGIEAP